MSETINRVVICEESDLVAVANAIRTKREETTSYYLSEMPAAIEGIQGGADLQEKTVFSSTVDQVIEPDENYDGLGKVTIKAYTIPSKYKDASEADVSSSEVLAGKKFVNKDGLGTGSMTNNGAVSAVLGKGVTKYTVPKGYHNGSGTVTYNMAVPTLNSSYPQDKTVIASASADASFNISISSQGEPAVYTYKWFKNGTQISGATSSSVTISNLTSAATYSVYCEVSNDAGTVTSRVATLTVEDWKPVYTYTGSSTLIDDGNYNWRIKFLDSGTLTFSSLGNGSSIDMFCVGGGGGGSFVTGGGGGYTSTSLSTLNVGTAYTITVGAGGAGSSSSGTAGSTGGTSSFHSIVSAAGGVGAKYSGKAGDGGSGGSTKASSGSTVPGGEDGADGGGDSRSNIGIGQHTTTREFGESTGALYSTGGACRNNYQTGANYPCNPNTGDGGNGSGAVDSGKAPPSGAGGSGIVIIRNHR